MNKGSEGAVKCDCEKVGSRTHVCFLVCFGRGDGDTRKMALVPRLSKPSLAGVLIGLVSVAEAVMLDRVFTPSQKLPPPQCPHGCATWSSLSSSGNTAHQADVDGLWENTAAQAAAGTRCALPGRQVCVVYIAAV